MTQTDPTLAELERLLAVLAGNPEDIESDMGRANAYCQQEAAREEIATALPRLLAERKALREALAGMVAFGEEVERKKLVGHEGCFWPVEIARATLSIPTSSDGGENAD